MLVTVVRKADGQVDGLCLYPETQEEVSQLGALVEEKVNLVKGILFLNKEPQLKLKGVKLLPEYDSPDTNNEAYRHR